MLSYNICKTYILFIGIILASCSSSGKSLDTILTEYIEDKDATIGVAVITSADTILVNGDIPFPMMSVYKFPIAMAIVQKCHHDGINFSQSCKIYPSDLHRDTHSPMIEIYGEENSTSIITINELLRFSLQLSDNNASDILLKWLGGTDVADNYIHSLGIEDINIKYTEAQLHVSPELSYYNSSTPFAMASLMYHFNNEFNDSLSTSLKQIMADCNTSRDRLSKPLLNTECTIVHKTGTGFILPNGRLMALNDVAYISISGNAPYSIAVFISDSGYNEAESADIIANISDIVRRYICN